MCVFENGTYVELLGMSAISIADVKMLPNV